MLRSTMHAVAPSGGLLVRVGNGRSSVVHSVSTKGIGGGTRRSCEGAKGSTTAHTRRLTYVQTHREQPAQQCKQLKPAAARARAAFTHREKYREQHRTQQQRPAVTRPLPRLFRMGRAGSAAPQASAAGAAVAPAAAAAPTAAGGAGAADFASEARPVRFVSGIDCLVDSAKYECIILDQFGVLHDGKKAYPHAIDALERLAGKGVKLAVLSNSSRRATVTQAKLPQLGFDPALFCAVLTSGELTHQSLLQRNDAWFAGLGSKCVHLTWKARGAVSLEGLGLQVVDAGSLSDADFILAHGTEAIAGADGLVAAASLDELREVLRKAADVHKERQREGQGMGLPLVIANPDFVTVEERDLRVMPGTLGRMYEEFGGEVKCMGKPDPAVFVAIEKLTGVPLSRSLMVGDSLHHDIMGAMASGLDSLFVAGGIHASELGLHKDPCGDVSGEVTESDLSVLPDPAVLDVLCSSLGVKPTYCIPSLRWSLNEEN